MSAKYKYMPITTMRTFDESPAKWFMVGGVKMPRKDVEKSPYNALKMLLKKHSVYAVHRIG